ncbi:chemotaxis protein CheW [Zwartia sp.]|uniref:chemotaxis protein CheW n=1 Tax=Zwartia sp. TaxID=2978004 RepID=UPI003BAE7429
MRSYLICESVSVRYAIAVVHVEGVYWLPQLSPVEAAPPWFVGSVNWHGEIVHVLDLGLRFKHPARDYDHLTQLIVVSMPEMRCGILVDAVLDLIEVVETSVLKRKMTIPKDFNTSYSAMIEGEIKQDGEIYQLLNLQNVLSFEVGQEIFQPGIQSHNAVSEKSSTHDGKTSSTRLCQFSTPVTHDQNENKLGFVLVFIGGVQYAIEVQYIAELTHLKQFAVLPCCPAYLMGVINLRGEILSVIDMTDFLITENIEEQKDLVILSFQSLKLALAVQKIICFQYFEKIFVTAVQNVEDQHVRCKSLLKVNQGIAGILDVEAFFTKGLLEIDEHV